MHGRGAAVVRDALGHEQLPDALRLDLADAHVPAADGGHAPRQAPAVAVEHRQRPQVHGARVHAGLKRDAERAQVRAAVRVDRALRPARGARGVVDRDRVVLVPVPDADRLRHAAGQEVLVGIAGRSGVLHDDDGGVGVEQVHQLRVGDHDARAAVGEDVVDFDGAQARVDRDQDGARGRHAEVRLEDRRGVGAQHGDAVAALHARSAQRGRESSRALRELRVRVAAVAMYDRGPVGHDACTAMQEVERAQLDSGRRGLHLSRFLGWLRSSNLA